jgi:hypothetical protein
MHLPHLLSGNSPGTHFCWRLIWTQDHSVLILINVYKYRDLAKLTTTKTERSAERSIRWQSWKNPYAYKACIPLRIVTYCCDGSYKSYPITDGLDKDAYLLHGAESFLRSQPVFR